MAVQQYKYNEGVFVKESWLEQIIFEIGDWFDLSIIVQIEKTVMTAMLSLAGGLLGGLVAGRVGFAAGAGLGGAAGYVTSQTMTIRELWAKFKEELKEILQIIINHLKKLDRKDCYLAFEILKKCPTSREKLAVAIVGVIAVILEAKINSSNSRITNA